MRLNLHLWALQPLQSGHVHALRISVLGVQLGHSQRTAASLDRKVNLTAAARAAISRARTQLPAANFLWLVCECTIAEVARSCGLEDASAAR